MFYFLVTLIPTFTSGWRMKWHFLHRSFTKNKLLLPVNVPNMETRENVISYFGWRKNEFLTSGWGNWNSYFGVSQMKFLLRGDTIIEMQMKFLLRDDVPKEGASMREHRLLYRGPQTWMYQLPPENSILSFLFYVKWSKYINIPYFFQLLTSHR